MRKFLAIFVVLALIAPAVFAVDFWSGGRVQTSLQGSTKENTDGNLDAPRWQWSPRNAGISAGITNDENTAGAKADFWQGGLGWTYAWWRPFEQLYIRIGNTDDDGMYWNGDNYTGWGLNANDCNDFNLGPWGMARYSGSWGETETAPGVSVPNGTVSRAYTQQWNPFAGDLGHNGSTDRNQGKQNDVQLTILPIDGMHLTFNWDMTSGQEIADPFIDKISVQAKYSIPGAGDAWVSFKNSPENPNKPAGNRDGLEVGVGYSMGIGNGMGFEVLVNVPGLGNPDDDLQVIRAGIGFGMGQRWSGGFQGEPFQFRARLGTVIGLADGQDTMFGLDLAPTYDLGIFRAWLHAGIGLGLPSDSSKDAEFRWVFSPYLSKSLGGSFELWTGLSLWSDGPADKQFVSYSIPFLLKFDF